MKNLEQKIKEDLLSALKSKDELRSSVLRLLIADFKNQSIEKKSSLNDDEVQAVIRNNVKKRKDSIESYQMGNRPELAKKEEEELKILETYLPAQIGEDDIKKIVLETINKLNAKSQSEFGKVMGAVMVKLKGQADGNIVSRIVKENLL